MNGKTVVVTGASSGIGLETARALAGRGARVVMVVRSKERGEAAIAAIRAAAPEARLELVLADLYSLADVRKAGAELRGKLDRLDVLVNNAGAVFGRVTAEECAPDDFRRTLEANLMSVFLCSRAALPELRRRRGSIINIASMGGLKAQRRHLPYSVAKAAVVHLTKCMALDHAPESVRVNCVCPAYIETDINRDHLTRMRKSGEIQQLEQAHPLGLGGTPEDVAAAALYLASDQAHWNTGCCLPVDGGVSATI
jgi:NAD(P)-dependent dehydrogenase (short-subunit alcohol dehydrogenase family)